MNLRHRCQPPLRRHRRGERRSLSDQRSYKFDSSLNQYIQDVKKYFRTGTGPVWVPQIHPAQALRKGPLPALPRPIAMPPALPAWRPHCVSFDTDVPLHRLYLPRRRHDGRNGPDLRMRAALSDRRDAPSYPFVLFKFLLDVLGRTSRTRAGTFRNRAMVRRLQRTGRASSRHTGIPGLPAPAIRTATGKDWA